MLTKYEILLILPNRNQQLEILFSNLQLMNALSLKTKKERLRSYYSRPFPPKQILQNFTLMCSSKNKSEIISMLKSHVLKNTKQDQVLDGQQKRYQSSIKNEVIEKFQESNSNFFIPKMQVSKFQRRIDKVFSQYQIKRHHQTLNKSVIEQQSERVAIPIESKLNENNNIIIKAKLKQLTTIKRSSTLPCRNRDRNYTSPSIEQSNSIKLLKRQSTKKCKAFFNSHKRKISLQPVVNRYLSGNWQEQLLQNINIIQDTNFAKKSNAKINRQKLSSFLKRLFVNEVITEYYKFENSEPFAFIKATIEDLIKLSDKETKIISFFTFDFNQDGFICENDLYHFLEFLPHGSKIVDDLHLIVSFLKSNKLQSSETYLPQFLLKTRQKTVFNALSNQSSLSKPQFHKRKKLVNSLFTTVNRNEDSSMQKKRQVKVQVKKYKINFQVFSLIFSDKMPLLISEIVNSLTKKMQLSLKSLKEGQISLQSKDNGQFCDTRSKQWMKRVYRSRQISIQGHDENKKLNIKIN